MAIRGTYWDDDEREVEPRRSRPVEDKGAESVGLLTILWRRKAAIIASVLLFFFGGLAYIAITPPRYLATTAMLIDPRLGKSVGADPVQPGFIADTSAIDSQIKLFTSQTVLSRAAQTTDLKNDPEFNGSQRSLLQRLLHPNAPLDGTVDLKALEDAITIKRPERTYVVQIDVLARDPDKAAAIANAITKAYIDDQITSRVDAAKDDTSFVRQRLDKLSGQIRDAETKVEAFKTKNNIVDSTGLRSDEQQVSDLTKLLADARSRASDLKSKRDEIRAMARRGRLDGSNQAVTSQTIERLRQTQADTEQNVARLAKTLGPAHPSFIEAKARQTKINALIRDELQRLELAAAGEYQSAHAHEAQILADVDNLKQKSANLSRNQVPLEQLERNVKVLRSSFDRFAQINDSLAQQEGDSPPGRVIAVARPPVSPSSPKKTIVGLISLSAGLFFGLALALFAEGTGQRRSAPVSVVYDEPLRPVERPRASPRPMRRYWDDHDDA
jgi:succinoglycan biosynthesis transport protein ExoP